MKQFDGITYMATREVVEILQSIEMEDATNRLSTVCGIGREEALVALESYKTNELQELSAIRAALDTTSLVSQKWNIVGGLVNKVVNPISKTK